MSNTTPHLFRRTVLVGLCIALIMTTYTLILAPGVGAASDATKTETKTTDNNMTESTEDLLLTERAMMIDEAKKQAQEDVTKQIAIEEAKAAAATEATEAPTEAKPETASTASSSESSESYNNDSYDYSSDDSSDTSDYEYSGESNTVSASGSEGYLMDIDNPDPNYVGYSVSLNDEDRDMTERILMGEAGGEGYIGMALVAQCIRDTYVNGNYSSIAQLLKANGYYGSTSMAGSETAKEVVNYIFDQGGSAVQHNIRIFYATNMCSSAWHEAQDFVCQYNYVRFFNY